MAKKKGSISLPNSNIYLKGKGSDVNGNSIVTLHFPNQRAFSIQTNGNLPDSYWKLIHAKDIYELTEADLKKLEKEVAFYVNQYGSRKQKDSLKLYPALRDSIVKKMKLGGSMGQIALSSRQITVGDFNKVIGTLYGIELNNEDKGLDEYLSDLGIEENDYPDLISGVEKQCNVSIPDPNWNNEDSKFTTVKDFLYYVNKNKTSTYAEGGKLEDAYFSKMYMPYANVNKKSISVTYQSSYNFDITIDFDYDLKGNLKKAEVIHDIKNWRYDISTATEIRGFENNAPEFQELLKTTNKVVKEFAPIVAKEVESRENNEWYIHDELTIAIIKAIAPVYKKWGIDIPTTWRDKKLFKKGGSTYAEGGNVGYETKNITGASKQLKNATHFAIHIPSNSIARTWDYKGYDKEELRDFMGDYFWIDVKDEHEGNVDKFRKADFKIVQRQNLHKYGIDLDNYSLFMGQKYNQGGKTDKSVDEFLNRTLYGDKMHLVFDQIGMDMPEELEGDEYHETMEEAYNKAYELYSKHPDMMNFKSGGNISETILRRVHPSVAVQPFIPYYEKMGCKVSTRIANDGYTEILGTK